MASGSEAAPDPVGTALISLDPDGVISGWDARAERLLGYTAGEAEGRPLEALVPGASSPRLRRAIALAAAGREGDGAGRLITKGGGHVDVTILVRPVRSEARVVAVAVAFVALVNPVRTDTYPWTLLTPREREIAVLAGRGCSNDEIASLLMVGPATVKTHLRSIYRKLRVSGRSAAVARLNPWPTGQ